VIELDFKTERLPRCLASLGLDKHEPIAVVWEGVSMYLSRHDIVGALEAVRAVAAPKSLLLLDFWYLLDEPSTVASFHRAGAHLLSIFGEHVTYGLHPEDAPWFLERCGYSVVDVACGADLEKRFIRDGRRAYPALYSVAARVI
jgi:O-methyltransferase involved in polyketide biosynthesis